MEQTPTDVVHVAATAVPLRRLGSMLRASRAASGETIAEVATRSADAFDAADLAGIEAGEHHLTDDEVSTLLELYGADPGDLVATRSQLVVDVAAGTVAAGPWSTSVAAGLDDPDEVLAKYLALLYLMRDLPPGTPIPLRSLDLAVLSTALQMPQSLVEERLVVLMGPDDGRVERMRGLLRRRVLVPAAGLVVAATATGLLVFAPGSSPATQADSPEPGASTQPAPPGADAAELGEGLSVEAPTAPAEPAPPGADDPELGEGLAIERGDFEVELQP